MDKRHFLKLAGASIALAPMASMAALDKTNTAGLTCGGLGVLETGDL